jgi:gluconolactonase
VFRLAPDGKLLLLARDIGYPNGLAFSPDEKTLYVCDSDRGRVFRYDVQEDGAVTNGQLFARMGSPDGMRVDTRGNLYITASDGVRVLDPQAVHLGTIKPREQPANCAFGDGLNVEGIRPQ